jgi:metal transporter CNNM
VPVAADWSSLVDADIGARSLPIVRVFIVLLFPMTWPLSKALDWLLGKEVGDFYDPAEFDTLIEKHVENASIGKSPARIMQGALRMSTKTVADVMTPKSEMYTLTSDQRLDFKTMTEIFRKGYSRVPVLEADDSDRIHGMLYTKDLMLIVPAQRTPIATVVAFFNRNRVTTVNGRDKLDGVLRRMIAEGRHIAVVYEIDDEEGTRDPVPKIAGLITMEDIMAEILQEELKDEYDVAPGSGHSKIKDEQLWKLADVSKGFNDLDPGMIRGIAAHLATNVKAFSAPHPTTGSILSLDAIVDLVQGSRVMEIPRVEGKDTDVIYRRGRASDICTVVLEGQLELLSGDDEIRAVRSTYDVLAEKALLSGTYHADFTARPLSKTVRVLRIARSEFDEAFRIVRLSEEEVQESLDSDTGVAAAATAAASAVAPEAVGVKLSASEPAKPKKDMTSAGLIPRTSADLASADHVGASLAKREGIETPSGLLPRDEDAVRRSRRGHSGSSAAAVGVARSVPPRLPGSRLDSHDRLKTDSTEEEEEAEAEQ